MVNEEPENSAKRIKLSIGFEHTTEKDAQVSRKDSSGPVRYDPVMAKITFSHDRFKRMMSASEAASEPRESALHILPGQMQSAKDGDSLDARGGAFAGTSEERVAIAAGPEKTTQGKTGDNKTGDESRLIRETAVAEIDAEVTKAIQQIKLQKLKQLRGEFAEDLDKPPRNELAQIRRRAIAGKINLKDAEKDKFVLGDPLETPG